MDARMKKRARVALRRKRVRGRIEGTSTCPRLSVFRSSTHTYAQLIDDVHGVTLAHAWDGEVSKEVPKDARARRVATAHRVGALLAERAQVKKIKRAVFDRGSAAYHGRVAAVAEGAREGGLQF